MNNAELIKALRYCKEHERCENDSVAECPYEHHWTDGEDCQYWLLADAADALEAAEHRIEDLEGALAACRIRKDGRIPKDGEWIWDADVGIYRCSECGGASPREDQDGEYIDCPNYCQNCGAKMRTVTDCHTLEEGER